MVGLLITDPPERIDARTWGATSSQPIGIRPHRLAAGMLNASGAPAWSQDASRSVQDRLWQAVAREPTNYDLTFDLVRVSTQIGDYEAAIGALERLLFYNPDLARVRYE